MIELSIRPKCFADSTNEVGNFRLKLEADVLHSRSPTPRLRLTDLKEESPILSQQVSRCLQVPPRCFQNFSNPAAAIKPKQNNTSPPEPPKADCQADHSFKDGLRDRGSVLSRLQAFPSTQFFPARLKQRSTQGRPPLSSRKELTKVLQRCPAAVKDLPKGAKHLNQNLRRARQARRGLWPNPCADPGHESIPDCKLQSCCHGLDKRDFTQVNVGPFPTLPRSSILDLAKSCPGALGTSHYVQWPSVEDPLGVPPNSLR